MTNFQHFGGRKFLMAMGAGITGTILLVFKFLDPSHFVELVKWTVTVYIAGGTLENLPALTGKLGAKPPAQKVDAP